MSELADNIFSGRCLGWSAALSAYVCTDIEHGPNLSVYTIVIRKPGQAKPVKSWDVFSTEDEMMADDFEYEMDFTEKLAKRLISQAVRNSKAKFSKLKLKNLSKAEFKKKRLEKFTVDECQLPHGKLTISNNSAYWKSSGKPEGEAFPTIPAVPSNS